MAYSRTTSCPRSGTPADLASSYAKRRGRGWVVPRGWCDRCLRGVGTLLCLGGAAMLTGCGDDTSAHPGNAGFCSGALTAAFPCPRQQARRDADDSDPSVAKACDRLVECGLLAAEFLGSVGQSCGDDADCGDGRCLEAGNGSLRCHRPYLDRRWCTSRLSLGASDPCGEGRFGQQESLLVRRCILRTPCHALGLQFADKRRPSSRRPSADNFTCDNGDTVSSATICDPGLLTY